MKNLNILLAAAMTLTLSSAIFAVDAIETARLTAAASLRQAVLDKNPKCKFSANKKFYAVVTRDEKDFGTSITVYNLDTNKIVMSLTPEITTIRDFKFKEDSKLGTVLVVKYRRVLLAATYIIEAKCKKCKRTLEDCCEGCGQSRVGMITKKRAFGSVFGYVPTTKR